MAAALGDTEGSNPELMVLYSCMRMMNVYERRREKESEETHEELCGMKDRRE
jgi:hypothetical protein